MTKEIYKVNPITFLRTQKVVPTVLEENKQNIQTKIEELVKKNTPFSEIVDELSELINDSKGFYDTPADTRFPYNISDLSTHLCFAAGIMQMFASILIQRLGIQDTTEKLGVQNLTTIGLSDDQIKELLFAIVRFTGLMHDITKPDIDKHAEQSVEFIKTWFEKISITGNKNIDSKLRTTILDAIQTHHETPKTGLGELIQASDWIATSDRIRIVWPEFMTAMLEKYDTQQVGFAANKDEIRTIFKEYIEKINKPENPLTKGTEDDALYKKLKEEVNVKHYRSGNLNPYFLTPKSLTATTNKLNEISKIFEKVDFTSEKLIALIKIEFKQKQQFIFESPHLKHIKGGSLLIQIAQEIFQKAFHQIACPELVLSSGAGELLGILPAFIGEDTIRKEVEKQFTSWISDNFKNQYSKKDIETLVKEIMKNISVKKSGEKTTNTISGILFSFTELLYGIDLENDPEKSYDDSYYYNQLIDPKIPNEQKQKIIQYFFEPTYLHQKFNLSADFSLKFTEFIGKIAKTEFFIQFQNKKGFGELVSAFELCPAEPKPLETVEPIASKKQTDPVCNDCHNRTITKNSCIICDFKEILAKQIKENPYLYENLTLFRVLKKLTKNLFDKNILIDLEKDSEKDSKKDSKKKLLGNYLIYDLDTLSENSIDKNNKTYIAFVKLDGNNFGIMKQQLKTVGMYQAFGKFVDKTAEDALTNALVQSIEEWKNSNGWKTTNKDIDKLSNIPVSLFIVGGDDISLALHSELALKFIEYFSKQIEKEFGTYCSAEELTKKIGETNITFYPSGYSGGIVFHKSNVPLQISNEIADELESKSKKFSKFYLNPYKDWKGFANNLINDIIKEPYHPRCLNVYKKQGSRIVGGAYNTISLYFSTADLSKEALNRYFEGKSFKYYTTALFPMDMRAFKEDFIGRINDIVKIAGKQTDKSNIVKSLLRKGISSIPEEFRLSLYYKAGKETDSVKQNLWQKMANSIIIKGKQIKDPVTNQIKSMIDWYEPSEFARFYWEER